MTPVLTDPRLIIGLDLPSIDAAKAMVERLGATISAYKVGLTLLARPGGVAFAHELKAAGKTVFQTGSCMIRPRWSAAGPWPPRGRLRSADGPRRPAGDAQRRQGSTRRWWTRLLSVTVRTSRPRDSRDRYGSGPGDLVERGVRQALDCGWLVGPTPGSGAVRILPARLDDRTS